MSRLGRHLEYFEQIFVYENARNDPYCLITCIINNKPKIDHVTSHKPFSYDEEQHLTEQEFGIMPSYLRVYVHEGKFDIPRLINDDYFEAIKLLYNKNKICSATKLILSCIDTPAFIEYGDRKESFHSWLENYADLKKHVVSPSDLWELRNGLLHMTNLDSRKIIEGKSPRIIIYIGNIAEKTLMINSQHFKYLNLRNFIDTISQAISKWIESYDINPKKWRDFVMRYDMIVSDARMGIAMLPGSNSKPTNT